MARLEEDLRPIISAYFTQKGFRTYDEVFLLERWIDVLAVKDDVVAVELKISDWKTALKQATMYQLAADYTFVAMPFDQAFKAYRHRWQFERDGVGLIGVRGEDVRVAIEPDPSLRKLPWLNELLKAEGGPIRKRLPRREIDGFTAADEFLQESS